MTRTRIQSSLIACALLALGVSSLSPAVAMQDDEEKTQVRIEKVIKVDSDGADAGHHAVFITEDGKATELSSEGNHFTWVSGDEGEGEYHVMFIDEDGERHAFDAEDGHFAWSGEDGKHFRFAMPHREMGKGGFLGVSTTRMTPELRSHFGAPEEAGVMVSEIVDDSAAFRAGIMVGDIITSIDGDAIGDSMALVHAIGQHEEGAAVTVGIVRDGKAQDLSATLGKSEHRMRTFGGLHGREGLHRMMRGLSVDCEDGSDDCTIHIQRFSGACDGGEDCDMKISCDNGDCTCFVDGEEAECEDLHQIHVESDE